MVFFFNYNQIDQNKISLNLISFITFFGFMKMITLLQKTINFVVQFVKFRFEVLRHYLHN